MCCHVCHHFPPHCIAVLEIPGNIVYKFIICREKRWKSLWLSPEAIYIIKVQNPFRYYKVVTLQFTLTQRTVTAALLVVFHTCGFWHAPLADVFAPWNTTSLAAGFLSVLITPFPVRMCLKVCLLHLWMSGRNIYEGMQWLNGGYLGV